MISVQRSSFSNSDQLYVTHEKQFRFPVLVSKVCQVREPSAISPIQAVAHMHFFSHTLAKTDHRHVGNRFAEMAFHISQAFRPQRFHIKDGRVYSKEISEITHAGAILL